MMVFKKKKKEKKRNIEFKIISLKKKKILNKTFFYNFSPDKPFSRRVNKAKINCPAARTTGILVYATGPYAFGHGVPSSPRNILFH